MIDHKVIPVERLRRRLTRLLPASAGSVRVTQSEYIDLLEQALCARDLEGEVIELLDEKRDLGVDIAALGMVAELLDSGLHELHPAREELLADPPRNRTGELHREAFAALVGQRIAEVRLTADLETVESE